MKTRFLGAIALLCMVLLTSATPDNSEKLLIGKWCNPYTYESSGEMKGFNFKKGGKCEAINVSSLDLRTWEIKDGVLIIKGFSIEEDGTKEDYIREERIDKLDSEFLILIAQEKPRIAYRYIRTQNAKKAYPDALKIAKEREKIEKESRKKTSK